MFTHVGECGGCAGKGQGESDIKCFLYVGDVALVFLNNGV